MAQREPFYLLRNNERVRDMNKTLQLYGTFIRIQCLNVCCRCQSEIQVHIYRACATDTPVARRRAVCTRDFRIRFSATSWHDSDVIRGPVCLHHQFERPTDGWMYGWIRACIIW